MNSKIMLTVALLMSVQLSSMGGNSELTPLQRGGKSLRRLCSRDMVQGAILITSGLVGLAWGVTGFYVAGLEDNHQTVAPALEFLSFAGTAGIFLSPFCLGIGCRLCCCPNQPWESSW